MSKGLRDASSDCQVESSVDLVGLYFSCARLKPDACRPLVLVACVIPCMADLKQSRSVGTLDSCMRDSVSSMSPQEAVESLKSAASSSVIP